MVFKSSKQARLLVSKHPSVFKKFVKGSSKVEKAIHKSKNKFTEALA